MTTKRNPWADRWEHEIGGQTKDAYERAMIRVEANEARAYPTRTCQVCGKDSFYRPGVGGWWCADRHLWKYMEVSR
jgi:ribosomal protein L37AE/L43A